MVLSSYTHVDTALIYTINANYKLQAKVENLTDKKYYLLANGDNNITLGSPRAYRVSMHANFQHR